MEPPNTNATEINSSILYENSPPENNSQIYTDDYYYDPNVGISGYSEIDNLTTVYNSSGFSVDRTSLEVSLKLI